ncbi:helix-turn-helix domain-containing protein [Lysinibacillus sp. K60]|uniref:helix-turn-helix domain-containing protein n=1 Tax=Lysinibacillus sp. K60 TaxID=2720027 RepID=UPI001C8CD1E5|nr:helix-turn-helix transcriptional regulator [Lysinibacillus sp. K60]MBX8942465.1 helix-turn-helix transcriptional regulator [Lysinibacillus sp. K60]
MVGEEIRRLRKEKGMTLKQLANNIDLSHTYLSQIELGDRNVSLEMLSKLASVLEVSKLHLYKVAGLLDETDILEIVYENKRLREALEFYADPVTYEPVSAYIKGEKTECYPIDGDEGEIALKALQGGEIK